MTDKSSPENDLADAVLIPNTKKDEAWTIIVLILGLVAFSVYALNANITNKELIKKAKQEAAYEKQKRVEAELEKAKQEAAYEKQKRVEAELEKERLDQLLRHQQLNQYKSRYSSSTTSQPKTTSRVYEQRALVKKPSKQTYAYNSQQTYTSKKPVVKPYKPRAAKYPRYSPLIKLKSVSKIRKLPDNRLSSTAPIFGRYKGRLLKSSTCDKNYQRDLGLHKECYIQTTSLDKLYFSKSHLKEFERFDKRKNYIECNYNKKHGVMQDCKVWRLGQS